MFKGRPLEIWWISALLLLGALAILYVARTSFRFGLIAPLVIGMAVLFLYGLMFRMRWIYFLLLLFLSMTVFLQLVASLLILSTLLALGDIDWLLVAARYWPGVVVFALVCGTVFGLSRPRVKAYFAPGEK